MTCRALALAIGVIGCAPLVDTAVVAERDSTGSSSAATSIAAGTVAGSDPSFTTGSADDTTSGPTATGVDPTVGSTGDFSTTGNTDETEGGGGPVGSPCGAEQEVCALALLDGEAAGSCGTTLDLKGIAQPIGPNVWSLQDCGACELCGGPTYTLEFFAPDEWAPQMPLCSHIAIDFAPMDATAHACAFEGVAIWADDGLGEDTAPVYVAASIVTDVPTGVGGLLVIEDNVMPEMCMRSGCCDVAPGKYDLTFEGAGITPPVVLGEKDIVLDVSVFSRAYDLHNVRSHAHKECGKIPHFDWVMRRQ